MSKINDKNLHYLSYLLLWIGGLNWGLIGLLDLNLIGMFFGYGSGLTKIIYLLIGLATIYTFSTHKETCQVCMSKKVKKQSKK